MLGKLLAANCKGLTHVEFGSCEELTDAAVEALAEKCLVLPMKFLCCEEITDAAVEALAAGCPDLTHEFLWLCQAY